MTILPFGIAWFALALAIGASQWAAEPTSAGAGVGGTPDEATGRVRWELARRRAPRVALRPAGWLYLGRTSSRRSLPSGLQCASIAAGLRSASTVPPFRPKVRIAAASSQMLGDLRSTRAVRSRDAYHSQQGFRSAGGLAARPVAPWGRARWVTVLLAEPRCCGSGPGCRGPGNETSPCVASSSASHCHGS